MGIAKLYNQKQSGISINGIIEDYYAYAGENISAGDFVEFVNGVASSKTETSNDTAIVTKAYYGYYISASKLDENRIFIAHSSGNASSNYLYGVVCTISGITITHGTDTQLSTLTFSGELITALALDENHVFLTHKDSNNYLHSLCCEINGTTITFGTAVQINTTNAGKGMSTSLLSSNKVFVTYNYSSSYRLYGVVCTISGTTVTVGTSLQLSSVSNSGYHHSTLSLSNSKVFIAHSYNSSYYLYGMVCTISGTTITVGTDTAINSSNTYSAFGEKSISTTLLLNGDIFIAHGIGSSTRELYGVVCSVSNTTISKGTDTLLNDVDYTAIEVSALTLPNGNVFIAHGYNNNFLYGIVCSVSNKTITKGTDTKLSEVSNSGGHLSALLLKENIFIAHSYDSNYYLYAQIWGVDETNNVPTKNVTTTKYETQVRKVTTSDIYGVAKTSGMGGIAELTNNLVVNGNFSNGLEGWRNTGATSTTYSTLSIENSYAKTVSTRTDTSTSNTYYMQARQDLTGLIYQHKYYWALKVRVDDSIVGTVSFSIGTEYINLSVNKNNTWQFFSGIQEITSTISAGYKYIGLLLKVPCSKGDTVYWDDVFLYDLTSIYGVGNEPTKEWCDEWLTREKDIVSIYTQSMNNLITNGDFNDNTDGWSVGTTTHCDIAHENGALKGIGLALGNGYVNIAKQYFTAIQNHIYYCSCDVINHSITGEAYFYISGGVSNKVSTNADWSKISYRGTLATYGYESYQGIISLRWSALTEGDISYWDNIVLYDLTAKFGAGNEPTKEWCDENL